MKRTSMLCAALAASSVAVAAAGTQQPQTQSQAPQTQQQKTASAAATTTFIGCLERGAMPNTFVLSVTEMPASGGAAGQVRGTVGTNMVGRQIQLSGGASLATHAGHKVQITGMMVPQGTPPGRGGQPAAEMRLNVSNVTMMSATCTRAAGAQGTSGTTGTTGTTPPEQPKPSLEQLDERHQEQRQQQQ